VADARSHQLAVQPAPEQLPRRRIKAGQMKAETAHRTAPDLHHGEVAVVHERRVGKLTGRSWPTVDLDMQDRHERPPYRPRILRVSGPGTGQPSGQGGPA